MPVPDYIEKAARVAYETLHGHEMLTPLDAEWDRTGAGPKEAMLIAVRAAVAAADEARGLTGREWRAEDAEPITRAFHNHYERLAPQFGYKTREASAVAWEDVPAENKGLMRATVGSLLCDGTILPGPSLWLPVSQEENGQ